MTALHAHADLSGKQVCYCTNKCTILLQYVLVLRDIWMVHVYTDNNSLSWGIFSSVTDFNNLTIMIKIVI